MIVILRPLKTNPWAGVIRYRNCHEDIHTYFTRSGSLYTGLTEADAKRLGEKLGKDLSPNSDYWKTFFIRTGSKDIYFNTEDSLDELRYLFLKNHKRVKTSILEYKASADYVLINKEEEAKKENILNRAKRDAVREFDKLSATDIRKALRIYGFNADDMTSEMAENKLFSLIEADPIGFLSKWVDNPNKENEYIISQALAKNVIRRNKSLYLYGGETIGHNLEEAVSYLNDVKNQDIKIAILKAINAKEYFDVSVPEGTPENIKAEVLKSAKEKKEKKEQNAKE